MIALPLNKPLDFLDHLVCQRLGYAPVIEDTAIRMILSARHKYAGAKSILEMASEPANEATIVCPCREVESKDAELFPV